MHGVDWRAIEFCGHAIRYSVAGDGRAVVLPKKDRHDYVPFHRLADRYRTLQVEPLGFGQSDRPDPYPPYGVAEQILAVCDAEGIEEFAVWGFSQGGAMALRLARLPADAPEGPTDRGESRGRRRGVPGARPRPVRLLRPGEPGDRLRGHLAPHARLVTRGVPEKRRTPTRRPASSPRRGLFVRGHSSVWGFQRIGYLLVSSPCWFIPAQRRCSPSKKNSLSDGMYSTM